MGVTVGHSHGNYFLNIPTTVQNCARTPQGFVLSVAVQGFESEAWGVDTHGAPLQPGQQFTRAALTHTVTVPTTVLGA